MENPLEAIDPEVVDTGEIELVLDEPMLEVEVIEEGDEAEFDEEMDADVAAILALQVMPFHTNLASVMSPEQLAELGDSVHDLIEADIEAREGWEGDIAEGMPLLGITMDEITTPWDGACAAYSPVVLESVMRFQAEVMQETCPAAGPAKVNTEGQESKELLEAAQRVTTTLNTMAVSQIKEYAEEHEKLLFNLALCGYAAKKFWVDQDTSRMHCKMVPAWDMIIPDVSGVLNDYPRFTQRIRMDGNEVEHNLGQLYIDIPVEDLDEEEGSLSLAEEKRSSLLGLSFATSDDVADYTFFECHIKQAIDIDPLTEGDSAPYIITLQACTGKILAIYRGWAEEDTKFKDRVALFTDYRYNPGMGGYGLGLLHMLGSSAETATAGIRQLIDCGTVNNLSGGFKDSNLNIKGDNSPHVPGEWRDADVGIGKLADAFYSIPYKEPSATLAKLIGDVEAKARGLVGLNELRPADMSTNAPVGTTLALLERALKPLSAIQARMHRYMRIELGVMRDIMVMFYEVLAERQPMEASQEDLRRFDVQPVSDSNAATLTQRIAQYQMVIQMAEKSPERFDLDKLASYGLNMIDFPGADEVLKPTDDAQPVDPITENGRLITGDGVKAFIFQDHEAHMQAHMALKEDPLVQELVGQSPQASRIMAAFDDHMREHAAMLYVASTQAKIGMEIPQELSPDAAKQLAPHLAKASQEILQQNQAVAAEQQAKKAAEDPVLQDQQQKTKIAQGELMLKAKEHDDKSRLKLLEIVSKMEQQDANELMYIFDAIQTGMADTDTAPAIDSLPQAVQQ